MVRLKLPVVTIILNNDTLWSSTHAPASGNRLY